MTTPHGLVIGSFMPPHDGHRMLIRAAAAASERLTVLVLARSTDAIPIELRAAWLRDVHRDDPSIAVISAIDDLPDNFDDNDLWAQHVALFRSAIAAASPAPVTAVFSSEPYGTELASRFGATAVDVDPTRTLVPISSTAIRDDLTGQWGHLAEPARVWFARRVVVIGAESTGKTTLSLAITDALRTRGGSHGLTRWVPEFGRDYTIDKLAGARAVTIANGDQPPAMDEMHWTSAEFEVIAATQNAMEDDAARIGGPVLVCDTDAFATAVWHERYQGSRSSAVEVIMRRHPLYLVTHHDGVPFEQDGIRDGEAVREWMTQRFLDELAATGRHAVILRGTFAERLHAALAAIDDLLSEPAGV